MPRQDDFVMQGRRRLLVETIKAKGITNQIILDALGKVPRHFFVLAGLEYQAYEDKALTIEDGQTISQPFTVAYQSQLLDLNIGDKVLEIGTGSGYQSAVLAQAGINVYSIERIHNLHIKATELLKELNYNVKTFYGDGYEGLPDFAPFDGIIITAAIEKVPQTLLNQLKINGKCVAPEGISGSMQQMTRYTRKSETEYEKEIYGNFVFVPMIKGKA